MACVAAGLPLYFVPCWFIAFTPAERDHLRSALRRRLGAAA
jgi:hypothetical protein